MAGRPTKLTPELQKQIVTAMRGGNTLEASCQASAVSPVSARQWIRRGEGRMPGRKPAKIYVSFAQDIKKARADAQIERVLRIRKAAQGGAVASRTTTTTTRRKGEEETTVTKTTETFTLPQWQADAWHLERSDPDNWALKDRKELNELRRQVQELEKILGQRTEPAAAHQPAP